MKKNMRKSFVFRFACALLLLCLTLSAAVTAVYAASEEDNGITAMTSEEADWQFSDDGLTLTGCGETFTFYRMPLGYGLREHFTYRFTEGRESVSVNRRGALGVAVLRGELYVTDAVREELNELTEHAPRYCIGTADTSDYNYSEAELDPAILDVKNGTPVEVSVGILADSTGYALLAYDSTFTVYAAVGELFRFENEWYYADYATLGNNYFDADGHISLRRGTVPCVELTEEAAEALANLSNHNMQNVVCDRVFEDLKQEIPPELHTPLVIMFWITYGFIGFCLPIVPLVLGLVFANKAKWGKPRRWYLLSALAGLWMLLSAALVLLLVL